MTSPSESDAAGDGEARPVSKGVYDVLVIAAPTLPPTWPERLPDYGSSQRVPAPHGAQSTERETTKENTDGIAAESVTTAEDQAREDTGWTARMAEIDRQWKAHRDREAEALPLNKVALFEALATEGITSVVVTFDGSGDSGQIEDITALSGENQPSDLPTGTIEYRDFGFGAAAPSVTTATVRDVVENLSYALLSNAHGGWENDDGAYGEFTFDVAARSITLAYNERYTASEYHEHEF